MVLKSISYSSYRDYIKCPLLFFFRRVMWLKLPFEPLPLVLGKAFHKALELLEKDKKDPVKVFDKEFVRDNLKHIGLKKFNEEKEEAKRLLQFWRDNKKVLLALEGFSITEYEVPFKLLVDTDPFTGGRLRLPSINGFVDFVTSDEGIGDYKTSSKKYTQEMVDESDQPTFYYLWHFLERGRFPKYFAYIVFRKGIKKMPIQILRTTRTKEQVSALLTDIQRVVDLINKKKFSERHSENERYCDCDLYLNMLTVNKYEGSNKF